MTYCRECGSTDLTWQTASVVRNEVPQGRLKTEDVKCIFFLGCDGCSEILETIEADQLAEMMNANRRKP